jgi:hypothetical protein
MKRTLEDNISKLQRVSREIERLSNPDIYYLNNYKPAMDCDKANRRHLENAVRNFRRLTVVVQKQSQEKIQTIYPWFKYKKNLKPIFSSK